MLNAFSQQKISLQLIGEDYIGRDILDNINSLTPTVWRIDETLSVEWKKYEPDIIEAYLEENPSIPGGRVSYDVYKRGGILMIPTEQVFGTLYEMSDMNAGAIIHSPGLFPNYDLAYTYTTSLFNWLYDTNLRVVSYFWGEEVIDYPAGLYNKVPSSSIMDAMSRALVKPKQTMYGQILS